MKRVFSSFNAVLAHHTRNLLEAEDAPRAMGILRRPAPSGPDWTCAGCREVSGPQFTQCWKCGAFR
jgi:hypothetical protein